MVLHKKNQFLIVLAAFLVLGISFKVMVLVEGLTEVRPVNAIPPVAGLLFGPVGALACAAGNLCSDMTGTLSASSVLGVIANFIAAYLPYRLWHLFSTEEPNLHKGKNIFLYCVISLITAMTAAWILSFGLFVFWGSWIQDIYTYVFLNNAGFSIGLGMPVFMILTCDSVAVKCSKAPGKYRILKKKHERNMICMIYLLLMLTLTAGVICLHQNPANTDWMMWLSAAALPCLICQII